MREKTSPLDVPKTKAHKLTSFLSQEGSERCPGRLCRCREGCGESRPASPGLCGPARALLDRSRPGLATAPPARRDRAAPGRKIVTTRGCVQMFGFSGPVTHGVDLADCISKKRELLFIF